MRIREYLPGDLAALERMHRESGFAYPFPELGDPRYFVKLVGIEENGEPVMAGLLRLTSEAYLLMDKQAGDARQRWERLLVLHETMRREATRTPVYVRTGGPEPLELTSAVVADTHAFLPPELPRAFDRRLRNAGWTEEKWRCWWRPIEPVN